ncbi:MULTISPECIES: hypothetical protein [Kluyvera]|uniref:Copper resistance protein n=1 Tax=Kluyvera genomosp. 3 TaxID=2774055 RepID=A0A248KJ10_9ENTR|nr:MULTISPECIES: hypothetical protein [Kluyvera]ASG63698.1 hypothetical protein CEW81_15670 [Kluyvera genomosp. 3]MDA8488264.1 hypothetical protein [Kluyvera sp. Awk 3]QIR28092.1 hypothetical protein GY169_15350 [Kluyvera genomosp. 3]
MHNRPLVAKWLLMMTCLAMAICLVQRAVYLHHFLAQASNPVQVFSSPATPEAELGPSPCQLSASSLLCAQPMFFDGALPAVILFLALMPLFVEVRAFVFRDVPRRPPTLRIHLKNCVFRE